ncbi:hypothetical protein [Proteiniclasticum ruminis]|uniref:hypothetical protein n=1 Tax=Proteiniclasticum ruminis TaxID=398199 RepID=UPI0028B07D93|nr:hypothetical protein [Proteiniclasticum ruminis]
MFEGIKCEDHPNEFYDLPEETQKYVLAIITDYLSPIKSYNRSVTSYGLKHLIQKEKFGNLYLTNGQFKGAMLLSGFNAADTSKQNWHFNVSKRSVSDLKEYVGRF